MKSLILYYSASGNTRRIAEYLQKKLPEGHVHSIEDPQGIPNVEWETLVLAVPCQYMDVPENVQLLWDSLNLERGIKCYGINSYSVLSGKTGRTLQTMIVQKGLQYQGSCSMAWPESYPPYLAKGILQTEEPSKKQWELLESFSEAVITGTPYEGFKDTIFDKLIPRPSLKKARKSCLPLEWNQEKCTLCGACIKKCPWNALSQNQEQVYWDSEKCRACWRCYNLCAAEAINSKALKQQARYKEKAC